MEWVEANGVMHRVALFGQGSMTVVLANELGGMLENWGDVASTLLNCRVLQYDARGTGMSEKPVTKVLSVASLASDLNALLDKLKIEGKVVIAGSAIGCALAVQFAATYPSRTAGIVSFSPVLGGVTGELREQRLAMIDRLPESGMRDVVDVLLAAGYPEALRGDVVRFEQFRARWLCNDVKSFAAAFRMAATLDLSEAIGEVKCPVLLVAGKHDHFRTPAMVNEMAKKFHNASVEELDSGHFMPVQTPALVSHVLRRFLGTIAVTS